jgi:hypothetical protein
MREPQSKEIGGKTYTVTPLPAMKALRMAPLAMKGLMNMTPDEIQQFARENLSMAKVDGKELFGSHPIFDLELQGQVDTIFSLLTFAIEINRYLDFFATAAEEKKAAAEQNSESTAG